MLLYYNLRYIKADFLSNHSAFNDTFIDQIGTFPYNNELLLNDSEWALSLRYSILYIIATGNELWFLNKHLTIYRVFQFMYLFHVYLMVWGMDYRKILDRICLAYNSRLLVMMCCFSFSKKRKGFRRMSVAVMYKMATIIKILKHCRFYSCLNW